MSVEEQTMLTRKQHYAERVFNQVEKLKTDSESKPEKEREAYRKRYGSMEYRLTILIATFGLAQALEFVRSRDKKEYELLLKHLDAAVLGEDAGRELLLARSRNAELSEYMRLTRDCLSALLWYKRFAESVLGVKAGDETEKNSAG